MAQHFAGKRRTGCGRLRPTLNQPSAPPGSVRGGQKTTLSVIRREEGLISPIAVADSRGLTSSLSSNEPIHDRVRDLPGILTLCKHT
jgi:hypothetical protein